MNHIHELKALAAMVRTIPQNEFNMGAWWAERENGCGTFGCVIGHGIAKGVIRGGLRMGAFGPHFEGREGHSAIATYFGISLRDTHHLFSITTYRAINPRRETVARRIEQFVAKHTPADRVIEIKGTTMKNRQNDFDMTKVLTVRREIEAGVYETNEKHEIAADRLLDAIGDCPCDPSDVDITEIMFSDSPYANDREDKHHPDRFDQQ